MNKLEIVYDLFNNFDPLWGWECLKDLEKIHKITQRSILIGYYNPNFTRQECIKQADLFTNKMEQYRELVENFKEKTQEGKDLLKEMMSILYYDTEFAKLDLDIRTRDYRRKQNEASS